MEDAEELDDVGLDPTEEEPANGDIEDENTYNDTNEVEGEDEADKRAIAYKIAKNKGLMAYNGWSMDKPVERVRVCAGHIGDKCKQAVNIIAESTAGGTCTADLGSCCTTS